MLHFHKIYQLAFVQMSYNAIMKTKVLVNISKECIFIFDISLGYIEVTQHKERSTIWEINPTNIPFSRQSMRNNQDRNHAMSMSRAQGQCWSLSLYHCPIPGPCLELCGCSNQAIWKMQMYA